MDEDLNLYNLEEKIFRDSDSFNGFKNISSDRCKYIEELANKFKSTVTGKTKLEKYVNLVQFLTSGKGRYSRNEAVTNLLFKSFDEVILFYILCCDKDLVAYNNFLFTEDKTQAEIKTRKEIGLCNEKLIKFERALYLSKNKKLITNVKADFGAYLKVLIRYKHDFRSITKERYNEIKELSKEWISHQNTKYIYNTLVFNIFFQKELLNLKDSSEILLFLILCLDPNYKLLTIYEEESRINNLKKRIVNEFGIFDTKLFLIEQECHNTFTPNFEYSEWVYQKKMQ